jgi:hypothetical protein
MRSTRRRVLMVAAVLWVVGASLFTCGPIFPVIGAHHIDGWVMLAGFGLCAVDFLLGCFKSS